MHAIDGRRVTGGPWALLPGHHELWLRVKIHTQEFNMNWEAWTFCKVALDAAAGETYTGRARTRKNREAGLGSRMQVEIGIVDASDTLRALPTRCTPQRPDLGGEG